MFDRGHRYPDALTMQGDVRALREGRPPPYASARLLEGGAVMPAVEHDAGSAAEPGLPRNPRARRHHAHHGGLAGGAVPPRPADRLGRRDHGRAAPRRPHHPGVGGVAGLGTSLPEDPATRPAMMVLGAAGLGAPLASTPAGCGRRRPRR